MRKRRNKKKKGRRIKRDRSLQLPFIIMSDRIERRGEEKREGEGEGIKENHFSPILFHYLSGVGAGPSQNTTEAPNTRFEKNEGITGEEEKKEK